MMRSLMLLWGMGLLVGMAQLPPDSAGEAPSPADPASAPAEDSPNAALDDPGQPPKPAPDKYLAIIPIHEEIDDVSFRSVQRRSEEAIAKGAEILVFELDTPGGLVSSSVDITHYLRKLSDDRGIKTVAWVRDEAISGGTMVAMGCDEIVMARHGVIGDCGVIMMGPGGVQTAQDPALDAKIESYVLAVFESAAYRNGYDPLLCESFVRYEVEVWWVENTRTGERRFVTPQEKDHLLADGDDAAGQEPEWRLVRTYVDPLDGQEKNLRQPVESGSKLLTIDASMAQVLGFSKAMIRDEAELRSYYGAANETGLPRYVRTWSEDLTSWLTSPIVRMFLITLIGLGAYTEFKAPGLGLPGLVAVLSLGLLLGAPYLAGLANIWEIVLAVTGVLLILVELLVLPGFGVAGITGLVFLMVGLLATFMPEEPNQPLPIYWPTLPQSFDGLKLGVVTLGAGMAGAIAAMALLSRTIHRLPYLRHLVPDNPVAATIAIPDPLTDVVGVGDLGISEGPLRPSGKVRFGSALLDVVTEGEYVDSRTQVEVIARHGNKIVVRKV